MTLGERLATIASGILLGLAIASVVLLVLGWRPVVLRSDSMGATAERGDLLVARPVAAADVGVGDVLTLPGARSERRTSRVTSIERHDGAVRAELRGDAPDGPDAVQTDLGPGLLRTVLVVRNVGWLVTLEGFVRLGAFLAVVGGAAVLRRRRPVGARAPRELPRSEAPLPRPRAAAPERPVPTSVDPRIPALAATLEALVEDGLDPDTARDVARVRVGRILRLGDVETSAYGLALDDGARFVLIAHAEVDVPALSSVTPSAARSREARTAVSSWWSGVEAHVPEAVRDELGPFLTP